MEWNGVNKTKHLSITTLLGGKKKHKATQLSYSINAIFNIIYSYLTYEQWQV